MTWRFKALFEPFRSVKIHETSRRILRALLCWLLFVVETQIRHLRFCSKICMLNLLSWAKLDECEGFQ
jgi:hypothetical protein